MGRARSDGDWHNVADQSAASISTDSGHAMNEVWNFWMAPRTDQQVANVERTSPMAQIQQLLSNRANPQSRLSRQEAGAIAMLASNMQLETEQQQEAFRRLLPRGYGVRFATAPPSIGTLTDRPARVITFDYEGRNLGGIIGWGDGPYRTPQDHDRRERE